MTTTQLKSRIAELETEVARLKSQVAKLTPNPNDWINHIGRKHSTPEDIRIDKQFDRIMRQLRDSDRELKPTPQLARLHKSHRALITQLKKLARFKSNLAAAEYAHREFTR